MKLIVTKTKIINPCVRCHRHVKQDSDFVRAHLRGIAVYWHFSCWIHELRQQDQHTAQVVTEAVR